MNGEQTFMNMLGAPNLTPAPTGGAPFSSMTQQQDPVVSKIMVPAANPQEVEQRKAGWMEVLKNPNMQMALLMMGANMAQPTPAGQSTLGHAAQSLALGAGAFQMGEYATRQEARQKQLDTQKQAESEATIAARGAQTRLAEAQLPGVQAASDVAQRSVQLNVDRNKLELEKAQLALDSAKTENDVKKIEADLKKRRLAIEKEIPDEKLRAAALAEVDAKALAVREARARIAASEATTKAKSAEADVAGLTLERVKELSPEEQRQFLTKTGKYSAATSGIVQQASFWGTLYDKLPADDKYKKGKTREQFQMTQLQSAKAKDITDMMKNYVLAGGDDEQILAGFSELLKANLEARKGGGAEPAVGKGGGGGGGGGGGAGWKVREIK